LLGRLKKVLSVVLLLSLLGIPGSPETASPDSGTGLLPQVRHGVDFPEELSPLPDGEIPFGKTLVGISSRVGEDLTGMPVDPETVDKEIDRLAERIRSTLRDGSDPRRVIASLNRVLFVEEGFSYDFVAENPENYLLDRVIARKRGNCLGLTALYLMLGERLSLPLRGVYVPSHIFVRYEDGNVRFNIEMGEKGAEWEDGRYLREFRLSGEGPYLRSLGRKETIAVYLKSVGATYSRRKRDDEALRLYREAALLYPALPDISFNVGVSYHKRGMLDEAIAQYRRALDLDPDLAVARDNLGVALAKQGRYSEALEEARKAMALSPRDPVTRGNLAAALCALGMLEDGVREYRKLLEIDPDNAKALAGLTKAHYARGEFHEAIVYRDRALERGFRFDPAVLGALEQYRGPSPGAAP
jgi:tetratricopeptide (TPR) repeat protein